VQLPQWVMSLVVLTHVPEQFVCGELQVVCGTVHVPELQVWPLGQAWLHEPQFCASVCVFTQAVPHNRFGDTQGVTHWPLVQFWPDEQTVPQAPQL
jgi:hypothetical protein